MGDFGKTFSAARLIRLFALAIMSILAWAAPAQAQHTSVECPPQTATVTSGGSVTINITDCASNLAFAGIGVADGGSSGAPDFPDHGNATTRITGGQWFLDYSHNGTTGIGSTDVFEITESTATGNGDVRVTITITAATSPITVSPGSLPTITVGAAFSQSLTSVGGTAPYTYSLESGVLPTGLTLSSGGVLSGMPTHRGAFSFSVRSTDATSPTAQFVSKGYTGSTASPTLSLATPSGTAAQGAAFSQTLVTNGGVAPYSYLLETGAFPAGITISSAGVISGTTSAAAGNYAVTLRVTDASTGAGSYFELETFTLTVAALPTVSIAVAPSSVSEDGATNLVFTVTRSVTSASALIVNLTASGTASSGSDYTGSVSSVTIPANAASASVTINPTGDVFVESGETVVLSVATGSGYAVGAPSSATGTIINDDAATGTVSPFCPTQNLTVATGGSVTSANLLTCDGPLNIGMVPAAAAPPFNGNISVSPQSGPGNQTVSYTHNGNSATSDTFGLEDENGDILTFNVTITPPTSSIVVTPASLPALTAGAPVSQSLSATGGTAPYTFTVDGGALPVGVTLSPAGLLSGTPTARGGYSFSVRAQDSVGAFTSKGYSGSVANPTLSLTAATGTATQTAAFSQTLATTGGVAPYVYQLETGAFPAGITISSAGVISGTTSAAAGNYAVTLRVTDASTGAGSYFELETFTLTVSPAPTVSISVAPASVNEDGAANLVYTVTRSQNLTSPTVVNLTSGGTASSGADYSGGVSTVTIPAGSTTATVTIDPTADTSGEPNETVILTIGTGAGYSVGAPSSATGTITNDDGTSTYPGCATRNVTVANGGTVRVDLSTCHSFGLGVVSVAPTNGTATAGPGPTNFYDYTHNGNAATSDRFVVLDDNSQTIVVNVTITPPTSSIVVSPASLSAMTAGTPFSETLSSTGGTGPYTYTVTTGAFPAGLSIASNGVISGTPTQRGSYSVGIRSQDSLGAFTIKGYTGTVAAASLTLVSNTGTAIQGAAFSQTLTTSNGVAPFTFLLETGSLPAGITLSNAGVLSGTTTAAVGSYAVTIRVTDSSTGTGTNFQLQPFTLTVSAAPSVSISVTPATLSEDGATNAVFTVTRSLNLSSATTVNLTTAGTASSGTDYAGAAATVVIPANATTATVTINPTADSAIEPDETVTLVVSAGTGYTVGAPTNATATILNDDVPTISIAVSPASTAEDGAGNLVYTVTLNQAANNAISVGYTVGGTATSGTDFAAVNSPLVIPAGNTTGTITINPTADAVIESNETAIITLAAGTGYVLGAPAAATGTIVNDEVIVVSPGALPNGTVASAYNQSITASGGVAPYSFAVTAGALPSGVTLSAGGILSGTPAANGVFNFTITATDSSGAPGPYSGSMAYALTILSPPIVANDDNNAAAINGSNGGTAYANVLSDNGNGPDTLDGLPATPSTVTLAELNSSDPKITLNTATGAVIVAPGTAAGSYTLVYEICQAGDPANCAIANVDVPVGAAPIAALDDTNAPNIDAAIGGTAYANLLANNGNGADTLNGAPASLATVVITSTSSTHPGVTVNPASGAVTVAAGTPAGAQSVNYTICEQLNPTNCASAVASVNLIDIPPVTNPVSLTVAYNAGATNVPLNITGGAPTTVNEVTPSLHGTVIASGTTITYQPNPDYAGPDSFTYSATNSGGTSAPATVTITVSDPIVTITAGSGLSTAVAAPYSQTFTFNGAAQPWSGYQVTNLPAGLSITGSTANSVTVSGTPTQAGTFSLNVSATDSSTGNGPFTIGQAFTLTVAAPTLALSPAAGVLTAPYGLPYTQAFTATGGVGSYSYTQGGTLPPGLSLSGNSVSGTPTAPGSYSFSITATDDGSTGSGAPFAITQNYTLDVPSPTIAITPAVLPGGTAAAPYSQVISATGGVSPLSFAFSGGALPGGLTLSTGGNLTGTPTEVGSFGFTILASDTNGQTGSRSYTLVIAPPVLTLAPAPASFTVVYGGTVSQSFTASGGNGAYSYAVSGSLPAGVTLNAGSGALSGSTIAVGTYNFTITATDGGTTGAGAPFTVAQSYTLIVQPPVIAITPTTLSGATVGNSYSSALSVSGGAAPYSFAVTSGALPAGLTLSSSGSLSGTPTAGGNFTFTVTASDSSGAPGPFFATQTYTLAVAAPAITLPAAALPGGQRGSAYSAALDPAVGGTAPFSYAVTGGALPAGVTLSSSGNLTGTPGAIGTFNFTVTATDSSAGNGPYSASQSYTLVIVDQPPVAGAVSLNLAYGAGATPVPLAISGGAATSVAITSAPSNGTALVSGTSITYQPNASFSGTDSFTYTATNGGGASAPATVTVTVAAPTFTITASGPLSATVGTSYSQTFSLAGGTEPFGLHQVTGLPAGLALTGTTANSLTISGTPRVQGAFAISVSASDSSTGNGPFVARSNFTLTIAAPNLSIAPASGGFTANYAAPFNQSFAANGGIGPYSYTLGGSLPAGVTLNPATGVISGTPASTGSFAFTVTATDTGATGPAGPFTVQGSYTMVVAAPTIVITPAVLPPATAGTAYSLSLAGSGAVAPYSFTLSSGALPAGVTLSASGQITGTPTASGSFPFTVTVRDANGQTGAVSLTLVVNVPTLVITPATLPAATQGIAYNQTLSVNGGIAPYAFVVSSGALPAGLALNAATGVISGTPTSSGAASFAITVTDSTSGTAATATVTYALQIVARPDPATDPEVRGLVQAQAMATRRLADAQINNFSRRLEGMHGQGSGSGGFQNNLRFSTPGYCQGAVNGWINSVCKKSESQHGYAASSDADPGDANGTADADKRAAGGDPADQPWSVWAGGTIRFGDRDPATGISSQEFKTEGISFGSDYRFSPGFAAGIGVGLGRDTTDVGDNGSRSQAEAKTIAIYGSHQLGGGFYLDWLGGYQWLDFDLRRFVTLTGDLINSRRTGRQWFASISTGADIETGNWQITPYARIDVTRGRLHGYTENGGTAFDLTFLDQDVKFTSLNLGARINYRHAFDGGMVLPRLRIEYQHELERNGDASVAYRDRVSGPFSSIPLSGFAREQLMLGAGAELQLGSAFALEFEYLNRVASGAGSDQSVQAGVKVKF